MTAARLIPHPRQILRALFSALRTTAVAGLVAWAVVAWQSPTHDWAAAGQSVWSMRFYLGLIFGGTLIWDYCTLRRDSARDE